MKILILLLCATVAGNQPPRITKVTIPAEGYVGEEIACSAEAEDDGKPADHEFIQTWGVEPEDGVLIEPAFDVALVTITFPRPGEYKVFAAATDGELSVSRCQTIKIKPKR